jgi:hypothetical protein
MEALPLMLVPAGCSASMLDDQSSGHLSSSTQRASKGRSSKDAGQPDSAVICGLPLPDARADAAELAAAARTLGSALGYLALLLDLLSRFLHLPVAHRAAFQGSTSRLWQPDGFFDMRAGPPADAAVLAWPASPDAGLAGLATLSGALGGSGAAAAAAQQQRAERQLRTALHSLARSAGMLVYARLGPEAAQRVPEDHSPFAWLAKLCMLLAAEPRAAAHGGSRGGGVAPLAASAVLGRRGGPDAADSLAQSYLIFNGETLSRRCAPVVQLCFALSASAVSCRAVFG